MVVSVVPRVQSVVRVVHLHMNCAPTPEQTLNVDGIRQSPFAAAGSDVSPWIYLAFDDNPSLSIFPRSIQR